MTRTFADELAELARRLSAARLRAWATVLDGAAGPDALTEAALIDAAIGQGVAGAAKQLISAWQHHAPHLPGAAIGLALGTVAVASEEAERRRPRLVVSGPTSPAVPVRLTSSVVVDVVRAAATRILLVSFAAHGVSEVVGELAAAAARGVRIDLILEDTIGRGGTLRGGPGSGAFDTLASSATFWHWPLANRPPAGRAALHAKVVVADNSLALLSSANFTDRGLSDNIEVGLLVREPDIVAVLEDHFRALMRPAAGCLTPVPRAG
jgi:cardiolipin synthase C